MRKILWISDAVVPTGFSRVSHSLLKRMPRDKYEIVVLGVNYRGDPHPFTEVRIYPTFQHDMYGYGRLKDICNMEKPDIIFILNDIWIVNRYLSILKSIYTKETMPKIVIYFPVDAKDHDPEWYQNLDIVTQPVVYTKFGYEVAVTASPGSLFEIIPHGVDTETFYKLDATKLELKKKIYGNRAEFTDDSFVVFNGNRNQPRKRVDITLKAFEMFSRDKPENVKLHLHMGITDSFIDISKAVYRLGLVRRVIASNMGINIQMIPDEKLNVLYNATDVGINTSLGEGWGLVNCEHAITGAPQIVGKFGATGELYDDCGITVPSDFEFTQEIGTTGYLLKPEDVATALNFLYNNKEIYNKLSRKSIAKFTSEEYSWDTIIKQWITIFDGV